MNLTLRPRSPVEDAPGFYRFDTLGWTTNYGPSTIRKACSEIISNSSSMVLINQDERICNCHGSMRCACVFFAWSA